VLLILWSSRYLAVQHKRKQQQGTVPVHLRCIIERSGEDTERCLQYLQESGLYRSCCDCVEVLSLLVRLAAESIIQLDLTRRQNSTPWGWPVPSLALLQELGNTTGSTAGTSAGGTADSTAGSTIGSTAGSTAGGSCGGCGAASLELALLRPADVVRLHELPSQVRH
jgi:hypothetical protein